MRKSVLAAGVAAALALAALLGGFLRFTLALPPPGANKPVRTQGIVALTGDAARVREGLALLAAGRAERLLITGVNRRTTKAEIAAQVPGSQPLFRCCVDLGYQAINTKGNAAEARLWAKRHGFDHSLTIVTSTYHMPRALADMEAAMPNYNLVPFAVASPRLNHKSWRGQFTNLRLLGDEYLKYLLALVRMQIERLRSPARNIQTSAMKQNATIIR